MTAYVPPTAVAVAYVNLDAVRYMPLAQRLPVPEDLHDASALLIAFDGRDWALAVRRNGRVTTSGASQLAKAMAARPYSGLDLTHRAMFGAPAWLVTRGSVTLPLPGNLVNVNRLLHQAEYVSAMASDRGDVSVTAECRTPEAARHLEENVRALASLARFDGLDVTSDGVTVRVRAKIPTTAEFP
jgi:hypothetical protein